MYKLLCSIMLLTSSVAIANPEAENNYSEPTICKSIWSLGDTPTEVIQTLGNPLYKTVVDEVENMYSPGSMDKIMKLEYAGSYILIHHVTHLDKYMLVKAKFSYASLTENLKMEIPNTLDAVIRKQGKPEESKANSIRYYCGDMGNSWVDIFHQKNEVVALDYVMHPD